MSRVGSDLLEHFVRKLYMGGMNKTTNITGVELSKFIHGAKFMYLFGIEFEVKGEYYCTELEPIFADNIQEALLNTEFTMKIYNQVLEAQGDKEYVVTKRKRQRIDVTRKEYRKRDYPQMVKILKKG